MYMSLIIRQILSSWDTTLVTYIAMSIVEPFFMVLVIIIDLGIELTITLIPLHSVMELFTTLEQVGAFLTASLMAAIIGFMMTISTEVIIAGSGAIEAIAIITQDLLI